MSHITFRQNQIADRFSKGMRVKEIARDLGISDSTVDTHIYNLRNRLGLNNTTELRRKLFADRVAGEAYNLNEHLPGCAPSWRPLPADRIEAEAIRQQFTVYDIVRKV